MHATHDSLTAASQCVWHMQLAHGLMIALTEHVVYLLLSWCHSSKTMTWFGQHPECLVPMLG